jgi:RimJ/RimL family protein N-acetyltransferase
MELTLPIETERLRLRRYEDRDVADILEFSADADYWLARNCDWEVSEEGVRQYWEAQRAVDPETDPKWFSLVVELKATGKVIGDVGIGVIKTEDQRHGTIGWVLGRKYQGQGLATEAARALLGFAFEQMSLHRVTATTSVDNLRSWRLMERLGMRREAHFRESDMVNGEWRDEFVYALLVEEWKAQPKRTFANLNIRPLHDQDIEPVVQLALSAWAPVFESFQQVLGPTIYTAIWPDWQASQRAGIEGICSEGGETQTWVAELEGAVVGFLSYKVNAADKTGEVLLLAVQPQHQNLGIGTALNEFALHKMQECGMQLAKVETGGDPGHAPARRCYEKAGYTALPLVRYFRKL